MLIFPFSQQSEIPLLSLLNKAIKPDILFCILPFSKLRCIAFVGRGKILRQNHCLRKGCNHKIFRSNNNQFKILQNRKDKNQYTLLIFLVWQCFATDGNMRRPGFRSSNLSNRNNFE